MITEQMINELNEIFNSQHAICKIKQVQNIDYAYEIIPMSYQYIENNHLYLNDDGRHMIEDYFSKRSIKIRWNNNNTIFWSDADVK